jgi:copper(I)-binding protein
MTLQEGDPTHLAVVGLANVLRGGLSIPVTFTLDTGESVTLAVPAQISQEPATRTR